MISRILSLCNGRPELVVTAIIVGLLSAGVASFMAILHTAEKRACEVRARMARMARVLGSNR